MEKTHIQLWEECLRIFADNLSQQQFDTWFRPVTSLGFEGGNLTLSVPTAFFVEQLEERFMRIIAPTLMRVYGAGVKLFYSYHPVKGGPPPGGRGPPPPRSPAPPGGPRRGRGGR